MCENLNNTHIKTNGNTTTNNNNYWIIYILILIKILLLIIITVMNYTLININKNTTHDNNTLIGLVGQVFPNGPGDLGSIAGRVIPKTLKMVLDISLLNTWQYKVCIEGKVEQSRERSSTLPYTPV